MSHVRPPAVVHAPQLPKMPWIFRASPIALRLVAVAVAIFVFITSMAIDFLLFRAGASPVPSFAVTDGFAALISGMFTYKLVAHASERRHAVHERLRSVADLNHHIRNALHTIQMSAHTTQDAEAIKVIGSSVNRIQWALEEIVGDGERKARPVSDDEHS